MVGERTVKYDILFYILMLFAALSAILLRLFFYKSR